MKLCRIVNQTGYMVEIMQLDTREHFEHDIVTYLEQSAERHKGTINNFRIDFFDVDMLP